MTPPKRRRVLPARNGVEMNPFRRAPRLGVLFVCMGNICRSPTAEAVFRKHARDAGLEKRLRIDSAGTHAGHLGEPPDRRAIAAAARREYDLKGIRARRFDVKDFGTFRYVLAMDHHNLKALEALRPETFDGHLGRFLEFADDRDEQDVPDPYYGGPEGFENVLDLVEAASEGLLARIEAELKTPPAGD